MTERTYPSGLSATPGYSHVVVASGSRLVTTAGAVPLDAAGKRVGACYRRIADPNPFPATALYLHDD